ncbi:sensor histidine kinase [Flavobacterium sp. UBA7663]|uniref:sensor histidine kinase n=1 Tax=Flavobacterium sp. UBA7663 TaxID=1946557 RepID=UPI0025C34FE2|nr:ATP-binding protein [Flavobacterium sp. UBA7663]
MKSELKITLLYIVIGILWIFLSDHFVLLFIEKNTQEKITNFQNIKGTFFVISTGILLYILLKKHNTAIRQKMSELKEKSFELEKTNKELENYFFLASHNLQEPNRIIISFLTNLEKKYKHSIDEQGYSYIKFAIEGAYYMRKSILNLQEYSKIGKNIIISTVDLNVILEKIITEYKYENYNVTFSNLPTIKTDENLIYLIFKNLIENAIKFKKQEEKLLLTITFKEEFDHWVFICTDNGIGIESEYHEKIFELFQRINFNIKNQGTGAGLPITKKAIEILGGKIKIDSIINKGSTFSFTLPKKT